MTVRQIFTKIGIFIKNRQIMLLNWNCAKLANFENFKHAWGPFFRGQSVYISTICILWYFAQLLQYESTGDILLIDWLS